MKRHSYRIVGGLGCTVCAVLIAGAAGICAAAESVHEIVLPPETAVLRASPLAGYKIAIQKCGICHSADYVNLQPPQMSLAQWTAEMAKMQHAYGAPIDDTEIKLLGIYLASTYGDAATVTPADAALGSDGSAAAVGGGNADVHAALDRNACLSCHALRQKVVGPAYHDVALKYAGDLEARGKVEANIRSGGAGKWGSVPMPPFPNLSAAELRSLADFVLGQ
jgi:cytochrome c551/c552